MKKHDFWNEMTKTSLSLQSRRKTQQSGTHVYWLKIPVYLWTGLGGLILKCKTTQQSMAV